MALEETTLWPESARWGGLIRFVSHSVQPSLHVSRRSFVTVSLDSSFPDYVACSTRRRARTSSGKSDGDAGSSTEHIGECIELFVILPRILMSPFTC